MSLKANVAANYIAQAYIAVMGFVFVPICIKFLGSDAYGLIAVFAIVRSTSALLDLGMKPALGREMARFAVGARTVQSIRDLLRSAETVAFALATFVALISWKGSNWLAMRWLTSDSVPRIVIANALAGMGAMCALQFIENIYVGSLIGLQRQVLQSAISCALVTARAFGAVFVLSVVSPTIDAFFAWQVMISAVSIPCYAFALYRSLPSVALQTKFSWIEVSRIWKFAGGVTMIMVLTLLLTQFDKIVLSRILPLKLFSFYAVASVLSGALYVFSTPISAAFYPSFTQFSTRKDWDGLRMSYHQAAQLMAVLMGGACIILIVFADTVLGAWTRDPEIVANAAPILRVLALGTLINGLIGIPYQLQLSVGWTSLTVRLNVSAIIIMVPALLVLAPRYGAISAAWIWVSLNVGYLIFDIYFMHKRLLTTEKWRWYGQDVFKPVLACGSVALGCRVALPSASTLIEQIVLLISTSICVVLCGILVCPLVRTLMTETLFPRNQKPKVLLVSEAASEPKGK